MKLYRSKEYLIKQLNKKSYIQIAKENRVGSSTIQRYMKKYGLTKKHISWSKQEIKLIKEGYEFNPEIYKLLPNKTINSVNHKSSRLGLKRQNRKRKYTIDYNFFKKWSSQMSYILGFFFSDGNVSHDKRCISIHLNQNDKYILKKISKIMGSNRPIQIYQKAAYFRLDSKILVNDLICLGCIPRKSLTLKFPDIPMEFLSHFIRGYFDGDGSIHFNKPNIIKISIVSTYYFLKDMQTKISNILKIKKNPIRREKSIWKVQYYGDDARKLCCWMYKNTKELYLRRKKERFDRHMRIRENGKI